MNTRETALPGVLIVEPAVHADARGWFVETFHAARYASAGIAAGLTFVQDNLSSSARGTLRGLHYQVMRSQGKLVWVTRGEVFDVVVDVRRGSPTFGEWVGTTLSAANHRQLWVPPGFAHGFYAVSEADVAYKVTESYSPEHERAIRWDDPALGIRWPLAGAPLVSPKDAAAPYLPDAELTSVAGGVR
ncbi:MAG: dTDP-4-dehydrorhamnose 3,5-epimerase [Myxococcales bacterium]|nr:dTDP-4-dehydrorhamnose 3,5-epimerase [Myxococcales bacterium]